MQKKNNFQQTAVHMSDVLNRFTIVNTVRALLLLTYYIYTFNSHFIFMNWQSYDNAH